MQSTPTPYHVLIVDDEPNVTDILARSLSKLGTTYRVDTANSAEDALILTGENAYDLIIIDYQMPDMNGLELITALRSRTPGTQLVLMTAHGTHELRETVSTLELDGYLDKPFTLNQIRQIVQQAVKRPGAPPDPFQTGERAVNDSVHGQLEALQANTGARCVMLISDNGYPIEAVGAVHSLDISSVGVLVAANFAAAVELSKLLGNDSIFKSSYHEGPDYNIYAYDVNGDVLLAVIFGAESRPGAVWFYAKQTATALQPELEAEMQAARQENREELRAGLQALDEDLDYLFDTGAEQNDGQQRLLNLQEATEAGVITADLLGES